MLSYTISQPIICYINLNLDFDKIDKLLLHINTHQSLLSFGLTYNNPLLFAY